MIARRAPFLAGEIADAVGGTLLGDEACPIHGVATDTRDPLERHLFVALAGERFDAHDFLRAALDGGAGALLVAEAGWRRVSPHLGEVSVPVVVVPDTLHALGELARCHRRRSPARVIGLTGSNGKTSVKEMIASIHRTARSVLATEGNLNNLIGAPLTLLGLEPGHEVAVVEMGMNAPNEIGRMAELAEPDVGLVINIGPAHIGELGSMEAIANAKGEMYAALDPSRAIAVVNADDTQVVAQADRHPRLRRRTFGIRGGADVRLVRAAARPEGGQDLELSVDGAAVSVRLPLEGEHNAMNAAAAVAAATALGATAPLGPTEIAAGLSQVTVPGARLRLERAGDLWLLDDSYNANRASMIAALETAARLARARGAGVVALLGEMRELGEFSEREHAQVGVAAARLKVRAVAAYGAEAAPLYGAARAAGATAHHEASDEEALFAWARARVEPGDVVLVKGSRGIRMERFADKLRGGA